MGRPIQEGRREATTHQGADLNPRNRTTIGLATILLAVGCVIPEPTDSPIAAWQGFRKAIERGNEERAWALLCEGDRAVLVQRAAAIDSQRSNAKPIVPSSLIRIDRGYLPPWRSISVRSQERGKAVLDVTLDGDRETTIAAVRNGNEWRVVLNLRSETENRPNPSPEH